MYFLWCKVGFDPTDSFPLLLPPSPHLQLHILPSEGFLWRRTPFIQTVGLAQKPCIPDIKADSSAPPLSSWMIKFAFMCKQIYYPKTSQPVSPETERVLRDHCRSGREFFPANSTSKFLWLFIISAISTYFS